MDKKDYLNNISQIQEIYEQYLNDNNSVDASWKSFFEGFEFAQNHYPVKTNETITNAEFKVINLINSYRKRGHYFTKTNPVRLRRKYSPNLDIENFGLSQSDLSKQFLAGSQLGIKDTSLLSIINFLEKTYCSSIGFEYMYIRKPEVVEWLKNKIEKELNNKTYTKIEKLINYNLLAKAVGFESFVHKKFIGQKRFSLEGAESIIPALNSVIEKGADLGVKEFVIGMAHRGRLNVLANIMKKPYESIFSEFNGLIYNDDDVLGDVKYHLGYDNKVITSNNNEVKLILIPNPSHLEAVGPVVQGLSRARIEKRYNGDDSLLCPIIIHGDAAIASQGVVYESLQMSQLPGYKTGGSIHLIINNQVGFTTNYTEARSSTYCTDIGKITWSPIFHVNGDDVEAVVSSIQLAMEYRKEFKTDVFIDILCYRRYGHNEGDEPRFTQPTLYKTIAKHPNARDIYGEKLVSEGIVLESELKQIQDKFVSVLDNSLSESKMTDTVVVKEFLKETWKNYNYNSIDSNFIYPNTNISAEQLDLLFNKVHELPPDKKFFNKAYKIIADRKEMFVAGKIDWAVAELLAYASLVNENIAVRLSGQDSERGTFSHRHATFYEEDNDRKYCPLKHVSPNQASFNVYNSPLSEYGVMGFEYGYAMAMPESLNIWEAQFGDFHNVSQVIIDQYISSAEEKWALMNGLVLMLPHGYEGQGPEHSSARVERFLVLAARENMIICNCTTPANLFHLLRKQALLPYRKPLIIFTPKSLLRHPKCISSKEDLINGNFNEVIEDDVVAKEAIKQIVFCSGKIYYDLIKEKKRLNDNETCIVRLEQIYPFPSTKISSIISNYKNIVRIVWAQEEPANMGALPFIYNQSVMKNIVGICRPASGSPAAGLYSQHLLRQQKILDKVFKRCDCQNVDVYCNMNCSN